jgi:hypothetical protein
MSADGRMPAVASDCGVTGQGVPAEGGDGKNQNDAGGEADAPRDERMTFVPRFFIAMPLPDETKGRVSPRRGGMILRRILYAAGILLWAITIAVTELFVLSLWTLLLTLVGAFVGQVVGAIIGVIQHPTEPEGPAMVDTVIRWMMRTSACTAAVGAILGVLSGIVIAAKAAVSEVRSSRQARRTSDEGGVE